MFVNLAEKNANFP